MKTPSFYKPAIVGTLRHPDTDTAYRAGFKAGLGFQPFDKDKTKIMLLLVDPQLGFIELGRKLAVPGAIDDTRRTIEWIFRNAERISLIATSLDSHLPIQIFFPSWWYSTVTHELLGDFDFSSVNLDNLLNKKTIKPVFDFEYQYEPGKTMLWSEYYLRQLETPRFAEKKKSVAVWPFHCGLGSPEHAVEPSLFEAIYFHSGLRRCQPVFEIKGNVPQTENYSIMEPEVYYSGDNKGGKNTDFLGKLEKHDLIYIAGQAKSHCVYETILSIVHHFGDKAPEVLSRIRIMVDCTSPVGGFEKEAELAFDALVSQYGLKLVKSTDPIA